MTMPQTKLSMLKDAAAQSDWKKVFSIAAKFHDLGKQRNAILDAHMAITNPRWMKALGRDVEAAINDGKLAIMDRYSLNN